MALESDRHADEEELERYSMGESSEEESTRLEEHLLVCGACRQRLGDEDIYVGSMSKAAAEWRAGHPLAERRRWFFPRLIPVMAALVCLATATALWLGRTSFQKAPPALAVTLSTTRGMAEGAHAPASRPLDLRPDLTGLPASPYYDLRVVDRIDTQVARMRITLGAAALIPGLQPGSYFVRIYSPAGDLLREYALAVTG